MNFAAQAAERLAALGRISDEPERLTRLFAGPGMRRANELAGSWMIEAGMTVRQDAIGNLIGHFPGAGRKTLVLGSHLDTVRDAGLYDGALGVVLAIACAAQMRQSGRPLPFSLDVIAFADEEGVRYQSAYLGSRAAAGSFDPRDLERRDAAGATMSDAIRAFGGDPARLDSCRLETANMLGYVEAHIEQGPVLDKAGHAVGLVTSIAGQTRARLDFQGRAGHAGTVPMDLRQDALCAAAQFILEVEQCARQTPGLAATTGQIAVEPNASNVIPSVVQLSLDVRHQADAQRQDACRRLKEVLNSIARSRQIECSWHTVQETPSVPCSLALSAMLREAALRHQPGLMALPSGAGHDAAVMAGIAPMAMLFVRCRDGVSHHPDESVQPEDIAAAFAVLVDFATLLAERHERL
ncbi:MAG TPA: allantoate amidohydrolase [Verrucomicrobiae bacterium]|jgi:allantoate deiminase